MRRKRKKEGETCTWVFKSRNKEEVFFFTSLQLKQLKASVTVLAGGAKFLFNPVPLNEVLNHLYVGGTSDATYYQYTFGPSAFRTRSFRSGTPSPPSIMWPSSCRASDKASPFSNLIRATGCSTHISLSICCCQPAPRRSKGTAGFASRALRSQTALSIVFSSRILPQLGRQFG